MTEGRFLSARFNRGEATDWVRGCAEQSGWTGKEAERLAQCVTESAEAVSTRAYCKSECGPVFVKLDVRGDAAILELHHEGSLGDKPCDCAAAQVAEELKSTNWSDAQLRTHKLTIARG